MDIGDSFAWRLEDIKNDGRQIQTMAIMAEDFVGNLQKCSTMGDTAEWGNIMVLLEIIVEKAEKLHEVGVVFSEMWGDHRYRDHASGQRDAA
jgi:hypothetical protein